MDLKYAGNANKRRFNLFKLNPQAGHEQAGDCFSPKEFNEVTGSLSVYPITHTVKGWGYEVLLPDGLVFDGLILIAQVKNLDWKARNVGIKGQAPEEVVQDCLDRVATYLQ
ncbi:type II toxin-antitoxin system PemK/MazF family toxin [Heyndrickxia ginsengihumi]|uniref:type II toxin-antitoxin system PemK/MazF family toxin n=1 Tax=Heyndrickxia ginsengihumi TaxID=363870 RepID=UPI003461A62B